MIPRRLQIALITLVLVVLGMAYYALRLRQRSEALQHVSESQPVAPPVNGPREALIISVANDSDATIRQQQIQTAAPFETELRARQALHELISLYTKNDSPHPLPAGADVKSVYLVSENLAVVDLNSTLADRHVSGITEEQLTIISLVQTLASAAPKITRVRFIVDGKERDTLAGHADLRTWYDVASVAQLARELQ